MMTKPMISLSHLWLARMVLVLCMTAAVSEADAGVPVLRDFEDLPVGAPVFNQYDGVTFLSGDTLNFDGTHPITIVQPLQATASPTRALSSYIQRACEFCGSQLILRFDEPQSRVSLSTGLAQNISIGLTMLLEGFTADPTGPGAVLVAQSVAPCLGTIPTPLTTPLEITDDAARIRYAMLSPVDCTRPTDATSGPNNGTILLDNLLYDRPLIPPVRETDPPIVTFVFPTNGSTVIGSSPGETFLTLNVNVRESALSSLTAQVNGYPAVPMFYAHIGTNLYGASVSLDENSGLIAGPNTVVVTAVDFDRPQNTTTASMDFTFSVRPPATLDVFPTAIDLVQSITLGHTLTDQDVIPGRPGYDFDVARLFGETPYLLAGKPTVIRVYGAASGMSTMPAGVPAAMVVERDYCSGTILECGISGGVFVPPMKNFTTPQITGITVPLAASGSTPALMRPDLKNTWNFLLPGDWTTQGDLRVTITINDGFYLNFGNTPSVLECSSCRGNNSVTLHLHFRQPPAITVNPVYIHVQGTYNGVTSNDVTPSSNQVDAIFQQFNELYPTRVNPGRRFDLTVGPGINKDDLLDRIKDYDSGNDREFFMGVFPGDQGTFAANEHNPDGSFVVGYGAVGGRGFWADADNPVDPAHELAHNIGFDHWACENGVTTDECGVFPIPHGGIGTTGMDIANWRLIRAGDNSANSTPHAHDFMSYGQLCGLYGGGPGCDLGEWVSWYTYDVLLDHPGVDTYDADDPPALLVSGRIDPGGVATLRPVYQIGVTHPIADTLVEDDQAAVYTIQGNDAGGNVLFVHNFEPHKLDVHGPDYGKVFVFDEAVPVVPNLGRLSVFKGTRLLGSLANPAPGRGPSVSIISPSAGTLWPLGTSQILRWTENSPDGLSLFALVQYSSDGGTTRLTLGRDLKDTELRINPDELSGSTNAYIYVQVSDGLNTATAQVGPFTVATKPPSVHIVRPQTNSQVMAHVPIPLQGTAFDREETLSDAQFRWSSDRDGFLGTGRQLTASSLSAGSHQLTLAVTDKDGQTGQDTVEVNVAVLGRPRLSGAITAQGGQASGVLFVDLKLTNTGAGDARDLRLNQLPLRTLSGIGTVTYNTVLSPTLPYAIGDLDIGASTDIRLYLNVPPTVRKFFLTENGTVQDVAGTTFNYSIGEAITTRAERCDGNDDKARGAGHHACKNDDD